MSDTGVLFWTEQFRSLNPSIQNLLSIPLESTGVEARIPFQVSDRRFVSPGKASFGGFHPLVKNAQLPDDLYLRLQSLRPADTDFVIRLPPEFFQPATFLPQHAMLESVGARASIVDINHHVKVAPEVVENLSRGNKKKFRQFDRAGGITQLADNSSLREAINLLKRSRERLGVRLSMTDTEIFRAFDFLPEVYRLFEARVAGDLAAAAVTVAISEDTNYVLYWGDDASSWRHLSPVVALFLEICRFSAKAGFEYLDLGTSSSGGIVNEGLRNFKRNLGAAESERCEYHFLRL